MLIVQKSAKSIQLLLNEFLTKLVLPLVSKSAYSQARQQLSHTTFIELNQKGVVEPLYCLAADQVFSRDVTAINSVFARSKIMGRQISLNGRGHFKI